LSKITVNELQQILWNEYKTLSGRRAKEKLVEIREKKRSFEESYGFNPKTRSIQCKLNLTQEEEKRKFKEMKLVYRIAETNLYRVIRWRDYQRKLLQDKGSKD